jgi:two-component system, cell cycle response regulator DivK
MRRLKRRGRADPPFRSPRHDRRGRPAPLILIVDDVSDQREMYAEYLESRGFRVETAADGASALVFTLALLPDLIVMDLSMPHLDGWETTRRLKQDPRTAKIPVLACTGYVFGTYVERALEVGCDAYVAKPCLPVDLLQEINRLLARFTERRRA